MKPITDRLWFLDNVRYWTVLAVIVLHVGMSQMFFPFGWPVEDPRKMYLADWVATIPHSFVMPVLFFLAGYFALPSLASKGSSGFLWTKFNRLIIPGALVVALLNPVFRYVYHYVRGFSDSIPPMSLLQYWPHFFQGISECSLWIPGTSPATEYGPIHVWFITVLFAFFLLTAVVGTVFPSFVQPLPDNDKKRPTTGFIVMLLILMTTIAASGAAASVLRWKWGWLVVGPLFCCPTADMPYHVLYYLLGIYAYRRQWFRTPGVLGRARYWLPSILLLAPAVCLLSIQQIANTHLTTDPVYQTIHAFCRAFLCMSFLGFLITFAERHTNRYSRFHRHMAANSYRTYLLHLTVVILVQFALLQWTSLPAIVVLFVGLGASILGTHLASLVVGNIQSAVAHLLKPRIAQLEGEADPAA
jgi:glucans biosynthesis protein C